MRLRTITPEETLKECSREDAGVVGRSAEFRGESPYRAGPEDWFAAEAPTKVESGSAGAAEGLLAGGGVAIAALPGRESEADGSAAFDPPGLGRRSMGAAF
jgi:hypothetical protein